MSIVEPANQNVAGTDPPWKRWGALIVLFMGGGSIYILPYLNGYFYIPMKDAMHLNNTQLGLMTSAMGLTAMIFYWPGGWIADRFSAKKLLSFSFFINGVLGLWMSTYPSFHYLLVIQLLMGVFLTLTYWSALIKATRKLCRADEQGRFFGFLEGGRNLTAGIVVAVGLALFSRLGSNSIGLRWTIILFSIELFLMGFLSWICISDEAPASEREPEVKIPLWEGIVQVVRLPAVWLITLIILCAYVTSVGITYLTPYSTDVYKQSVVFGGMLYTIMQWSSILASPASGFLADRITTSKATLLLFILMALSLFLFVAVNGGRERFYLLLINSIAIGCEIYALRGIYYALLEEGKVPLALTGSATGLISLIAYTPDVFIPLLAGHLLDKYSAGGVGYRYFFLTLAIFAVLGVILTVIFRRTVTNASRVREPHISSNAIPES
jgi:MFS transporter, GlpU family, inner membrane protein